eukprot:1161748-Pelagomonas_calceolata.AAC.3
MGDLLLDAFERMKTHVLLYPILDAHAFETERKSGHECPRVTAPKNVVADTIGTEKNVHVMPMHFCACLCSFASCVSVQGFTCTYHWQAKGELAFDTNMTFQSRMRSNRAGPNASNAFGGSCIQVERHSLHFAIVHGENVHLFPALSCSH